MGIGYQDNRLGSVLMVVGATTYVVASPLYAPFAANRKTLTLAGILYAAASTMFVMADAIDLSILSKNNFASLLLLFGSAFYVCGSVYFIPAVESPFLGRLFFEVGSLFFMLAALRRLASLPRSEWLLDSLTFVGALFFFSGGYARSEIIWIFYTIGASSFFFASLVSLYETRRTSPLEGRTATKHDHHPQVGSSRRQGSSNGDL